MKIEIKSAGIALKAVLKYFTKLDVVLFPYPADIPIGIDMINLKSVAISAIDKVVFAPYIIREKISLPIKSDPKIYLLFGANGDFTNDNFPFTF